MGLFYNDNDTTKAYTKRLEKIVKEQKATISIKNNKIERMLYLV